jgi:hypothetical protein
MGMGKTTNAKFQKMGQWPNMKANKRAEMGLGLKQYYKGWAWVLNKTIKAKLYRANYGPISQL